MKSARTLNELLGTSFVEKAPAGAEPDENCPETVDLTDDSDPPHDQPRKSPSKYLLLSHMNNWTLLTGLFNSPKGYDLGQEETEGSVSEAASSYLGQKRSSYRGYLCEGKGWLGKDP